MKSIALLLTTLITSPLTLMAETPKQQLAAAQKIASAEKKDLLMIFSGVEWHRASQDFAASTLKTEAFKKGIAKDFVQVLFEVPRERAKAHKELLELQQTYRFRELPSMVLTDAGGRPYAYTGARDQDVTACLKSLSEFHKVRVERDRLFTAAVKAKGMKRAEFLVTALKSMPQDMVRDFYSAELATIASADPKGKTGYVKEIEEAEVQRKRRERFAMFFQNKQYDQVIMAARAEGAKLKGEQAQMLKVYEIQALASQNKFDEALKEVEVMKEMAPESVLGKRSSNYLAALNNAKARFENTQKAVKTPKKPVVSKPVAIVRDINVLKKEAKEVEEALAKAIANEKKLKKANVAAAQKMEAMRAELQKLNDIQARDNAALDTIAAEREKLARRAQAMKEVVEGHEAMERRKLDISDLEKKAVELQKQADALRKKAKAIKAKK